MQDVTKYGGFNDIAGTYFFLVEHTEKKNRIRTIESVPLYIAKKIDQNPIELENTANKYWDLLILI